MRQVAAICLCLSCIFLELHLLLTCGGLFCCSFVRCDVAIMLSHSCIAFSANAVSASATAILATTSAASAVAPAASAASLAFYAKVNTIVAFLVFCVSSVLVICSCMMAFASDAAVSRSASLFALRSRCRCNSFSMLGNTLCPARCSIRSFAGLSLSGSCLSSMAIIPGVRETGSLMRLPLELLASDTDPSLTLSLLLPLSWLRSSTRDWNLLCCMSLTRVGSTSTLCARLSGEVSLSLRRTYGAARDAGAFPLFWGV